MVQLSNDCFAHGGGVLTLAAALSRIAERVSPIAETQVLPLRRALHRVLAGDLVAGRNVPPHDNAAVDGYAVCFDDLNAKGDSRLPVTGRVAAGHPLERPARRGEAIRVFTGAPMPPNLDTVFMEEDCRAEAEQVILPAGIKRGDNRRLTGEDVTTGAVIVPAGRLLRAQELGIAASVGITQLTVFRQLTVAVFSTGDEVCDPSGEAAPGSIFDANRFTLMSLAEALGCRVEDLGILPDRPQAVARSLLAAAEKYDVLLTSGGVSGGEEDHVAKVVGEKGKLHFWRLAIKPGRPVALGQIGNATFIGLPGNPVAAMVTFLRVARPILLRMAGRDDVVPTLFAVRAGFSFQKKEGRREWLRVWLEHSSGGAPVAHRCAADGAGMLSSMVAADGLVELAEEVQRVNEGALVDFLPFSEVTH